MPYAVDTYNWELFVNAGTTALRLINPISVNCINQT